MPRPPRRPASAPPPLEPRSLPRLQPVALPRSLTGPDVAPVVAVAARPAEGDGPLSLGAGADLVASALGLDLPLHLERAKARGRAGEVTVVPVGAAGAAVETVLLVGVGDGEPTELRRAGAALCRRAGDRARVLALVVADGESEGVRAFAEGYALAAYAPPRRGLTAEAPVPQLLEVAVRRPASAVEPLRRAQVTAAAVHLARDLGNTSPDVKSPDWLARQAVRAATAAGRVTAAVWDLPALEEGGFGGLLAVGAGSARPPRFVRLDYRPSDPGGAVPHVVLLGKGIVFDSGGISIKPAAGMELMKTDMGGAAAVAGVMAALADLGVRARVTGLLAIAENLPSGSAQRPSDVIRPYGGGRTVEVVNTDAEGRLVLADGLAYADAELDPDVVVDIATLTGAATLALGRRDAPLYASDEGLAAALSRAAAAAGERVWRMPLPEDYRPAIDSTVADVRNAVTDRRLGGGSITAALFLREFTGGRTWAHLDIAGTGRAEADENEVSKGATGFGVRLLLRWLESGRLTA